METIKQLNMTEPVKSWQISQEQTSQTAKPERDAAKSNLITAVSTEKPLQWLKMIERFIIIAQRS